MLFASEVLFRALRSSLLPAVVILDQWNAMMRDWECGVQHYKEVFHPLYPTLEGYYGACNAVVLLGVSSSGDSPLLEKRRSMMRERDRCGGALPWHCRDKQ